MQAERTLADSRSGNGVARDRSEDQGQAEAAHEVKEAGGGKHEAQADGPAGFYIGEGEEGELGIPHDVGGESGGYGGGDTANSLWVENPSPTSPKP